MSSLHDQIMNLYCVDANMEESAFERLAYKVGHRDARHAAAKLALQKDREIEALRECAIRYLSWLSIPNPSQALDEAVQHLLEDATSEKLWIPHEGGVCPVPDGTLLDVKWRSGSIKKAVVATSSMHSYSDASGAFWRHDGINGDIVAYRLAN